MQYTAAVLLTIALIAGPAAAGPQTGPLKNNPKMSFVSPADPPFFVWPVQTGAKSYQFEMSRNKSFPQARTLRVDTSRNFFMPGKIMGAGNWYYRVKPDNGPWSDVFTVTITGDAYRFLVPKRRTAVPAHPRLYFRAGDIATLRADAAGSKKALWSAIKKQADELIGKPLIPEPPKCHNKPDGSFDIVSWRKVVDTGGSISTNLIYLSFAYVISRDKAYLNEARRTIDHLCSWQVPGSTGDPYSVDHPARDILHALSMAYDWLYSDLTPQEREKLRSVIIARADRLYQFDNPFYGLGVNNHPWLRMAGLADAGCALLDEYPKADEWLDYTEGLYAGRFWCLGGKDGEWHEGISYWSYALLFALQFADVVKSSTGVDFYKHPWMRQCPYFPIYAFVPGGAGLPYGDVHLWQTDITTIIAEMRLAKAMHNPYAKWYTDIPYDSSQLYVDRYLADDTKLPAKAPKDLPQSILFRDSGWSVFHTSLDGPDDVFFTMKSGHFFSSGHEHPDQNSFALEAYKKRLVIDSGYYDYYGSPHHYGWVVLTKAHNVIMVDGKGQAGMLEDPDKEASGKTIAFFRSPGVNYAVGDASNPHIYHGNVKTFIRMAAFLAPDVVAIYDIVDLPKPSKLDWLLHTTADPAMDPMNTGFDMNCQGVGLRFDMLMPSSIEFSRTIGYGNPPEKENPQDAHLTFAIPGKTSSARFLTVYQPYKVASGKPARKLSRIDGVGACAAQIGSNQVLFRSDMAAKSVSAGRITTDGLMATIGNGEWSVCEGKSITVDGKQILSATRPVSAARHGRDLSIRASQDCTVRIRCIGVNLNSLGSAWVYNSGTHLLSGRVSAGECMLKDVFTDGGVR